MIDNNRLQHIIGVARECYTIATERGHDADFCKKMFMLGWCHDIGYEFDNGDHAKESAKLMELLDCKYSAGVEAVKNHGKCTGAQSEEWIILCTADLTVDSNGNNVGVMSRLEDIRARHGEHSNAYLTACDLAYQLKLTHYNIAGNIT